MAITIAAATAIKALAPGVASTGPVSIPGLQTGDFVLRVIPDGFTSGFEDVISVNDQIQQLSNLDWSSVTLTFYLLRGV
ncbi:hypothetical protein [Burkholderia ubonensis]|uniref:hypothetical protein n=1 Tax=Burkholderia ubonensis TaxID=101571 RepID=UPI000A6D5393|nr:hypothetical protein [Burkholderia ubonensis]